MKREYNVAFEINVFSDNPRAACQDAWRSLCNDVVHPVGTVTNLMTGDAQNVDLDEDESLHENPR